MSFRLLAVAVLALAVAAHALSASDARAERMADAHGKDKHLSAAATLRRNLRRAVRTVASRVPAFANCDTRLPTRTEFMARFSGSEHAALDAPLLNALANDVMLPDNADSKDSDKVATARLVAALALPGAVTRYKENKERLGNALTRHDRKALEHAAAFKVCAELYRDTKLPRITQLLGTYLGAQIWFSGYRVALTDASMTDDPQFSVTLFPRAVRGGDKSGLFDVQENLQFDPDTGALSPCAEPDDDSSKTNRFPRCQGQTTVRRPYQNLVVRVVHGGEARNRFTVRPLSGNALRDADVARQIDALPFQVYRQPVPARSVGPVPTGAGAPVDAGPRVQYLPYMERECYAMPLSETDDQSRFVFTAAMNGCNYFTLTHPTKQPIVMHCNANLAEIENMYVGAVATAGETSKDFMAELMFARYHRAGYTRGQAIRRAEYTGAAPHSQFSNLATIGVRAHPQVGGAPSNNWQFRASYIEAAPPAHLAPLKAFTPAGAFQDPYYGLLGAWTAKDLHLSVRGVHCPCHARLPTKAEYATLIAWANANGATAPPANAAVEPAVDALLAAKPATGAGTNSLYNSPAYQRTGRAISQLLTTGLRGAVWSARQREAHDYLRQCVAMFLTAAANPGVHSQLTFGPDLDCKTRVPTPAEYVRAVPTPGDQLAQHTDLPVSALVADSRVNKRALLNGIKTAIAARLALNTWSVAVAAAHRDLATCIDTYLQHTVTTALRVSGVDCKTRLPSKAQYLAALGGEPLVYTALPPDHTTKLAPGHTRVAHNIPVANVLAVKAAHTALQNAAAREKHVAQVHADMSDCLATFIAANGL